MAKKFSSKLKAYLPEPRWDVNPRILYLATFSSVSLKASRIFPSTGNQRTKWKRRFLRKDGIVHLYLSPSKTRSSVPNVPWPDLWPDSFTWVTSPHVSRSRVLRLQVCSLEHSPQTILTSETGMQGGPDLHEPAPLVCLLFASMEGIILDKYSNGGPNCSRDADSARLSYCWYIHVSHPCESS